MLGHLTFSDKAVVDDRRYCQFDGLGFSLGGRREEPMSARLDDRLVDRPTVISGLKPSRPESASYRPRDKPLINLAKDDQSPPCIPVWAPRRVLGQIG